MQQPLLDNSIELKTKVISTRADFDQLFAGFKRLKAVSFVVSPRLLLDLMYNRGFQHVEIVVGEDIAPLSREQLKAAGVEILDALAKHIEEGRLRVLTPHSIIHTKLYILENQSRTRVIQTSANLTEAAQRASRQTNYAWYFDVDGPHPWLETALKDYEVHTRRCDLFMDDLLVLFKEALDTPRPQVIEAWLAGTSPTTPATETSKVIQELSLQALTDEDAEVDKVFTIALPEAPLVRKQTESVLARLNVPVTGKVAQVHRGKFLSYVQATTGLPLMTVSVERGDVRLFFDRHLKALNLPVPEGSQINSGLELLEAYFDTVEWGESLDREFARAAMYEATLYMLAAPFAHEQQKIMRRAYGILEKRGPRFLYLVGQSSNGKTTFLRFALKLITGRLIDPLPSEAFTKSKIKESSMFGTVFPLVFDDVNPVQRGSFEEVIKSHWEVWWREGAPSPQLIVSSNNRGLKEWAKTRVKRIDFDIHFAPNAANRTRLAAIFENENFLFAWFSTLYLERLRAMRQPTDDELSLSRIVMQELYSRAERSLPAYFPKQPLELTYNPDSIQWRGLLYRTKQAVLRDEKDRLIVQFDTKLQYHEMREYVTALPPTVKHDLKGNVLTIESPGEFRKFIGNGHLGRKGLLGHIFAR